MVWTIDAPAARGAHRGIQRAGTSAGGVTSASDVVDAVSNGLDDTRYASKLYLLLLKQIH